MDGKEKDEANGSDDQPNGWDFDFQLVDSTGSLVFPTPPPNYATKPFDPAGMYFVDSKGEKQSVKVLGTYSRGVIFVLARTQDQMNEEISNAPDSTFIWKIYENSQSVPDTLQFKNPDYYTGRNAEFIVFNSDTLFKGPYENNPDTIAPEFKIVYP